VIFLSRYVVLSATRTSYVRGACCDAPCSFWKFKNGGRGREEEEKNKKESREAHVFNLFEKPFTKQQQQQQRQQQRERERERQFADTNYHCVFSFMLPRNIFTT
jgi:hypothetical protein